MSFGPKKIQKTKINSFFNKRLSVDNNSNVQLGGLSVPQKEEMHHNFHQLISNSKNPFNFKEIKESNPIAKLTSLSSSKNNKNEDLGENASALQSLRNPQLEISVNHKKYKHLPDLISACKFSPINSKYNLHNPIFGECQYETIHKELTENYKRDIKKEYQENKRKLNFTEIVTNPYANHLNELDKRNQKRLNQKFENNLDEIKITKPMLSKNEEEKIKNISDKIRKRAIYRKSLETQVRI